MIEFDHKQAYYFSGGNPFWSYLINQIRPYSLWKMNDKIGSTIIRNFINQNTILKFYDDFNNWSGSPSLPVGWAGQGIVGNDPEITQVDSGQLHGGSNIVGGSVNIFSSLTAFQPRLVINQFTIGKTYKLSCYCSNTVGNIIRARAADDSILVNVSTIGLSSIEDIPENIQLQILGMGTLPNNGTIDWIKLEETGDLDGINNGATLEADNFMGVKVPTFTTNDFIQDNYIRQQLNFNPLVGSISIVARMPNSALNSSLSQGLRQLGVDSANRVILYHDVSPYVMRFNIVCNNIGISIPIVINSSFDDKFFIMTATWNQAQNRTNLYINNLANNTTYPAGVWTGTMTSGRCTVGSLFAGNFMEGTLTCKFDCNYEMTQAQHLKLYNYMKQQMGNLVA